MTEKKKNKNKKVVWFMAAGMALIFLLLFVCVVKLLVSDDGQKHQRQIKMVTVVKPPPPPKVQEKPPEPEIKKEEILEPVPEEQPPEDMAENDDAPPAGDELGLDADGSSGSDGFGLKAKKGGRPLIGSGNGSTKYGWYTNLLINEIQQLVNKMIQKNGGVPDEKFESLVKLILNDEGMVIDFDIIDSSGNGHVDQAISDALVVASISEPPPVGMPRHLKVRISPRS